MDWHKAKSDRHLDNDLRMLSSTRYIVGTYTFDHIERIIAWHFTMSKWSNKIIESLANKTKLILPMEVALPYAVFVARMTPNTKNQDEMNDIFDIIRYAHCNMVNWLTL